MNSCLLDSPQAAYAEKRGCGRQTLRVESPHKGPWYRAGQISGIFPSLCPSRNKARMHVAYSLPFLIAFVAFSGSKASGSNRPPIHSSISSCCSFSGFLMASKKSA